MNNYCTNCGKRLNKNENPCTKCNTPVLEIPKEEIIPKIYKKKTKEQIEKYNTRMTIIRYIVLIFIAVIIFGKAVNIFKLNSIKKQNIEPFIKNNYPSGKYKIKYSNSGKCLIGERCIKESESVDCDGSTLVPEFCTDTQYYYDDDCKAYYYEVDSDNLHFTATAYKYFDEDNFHVVEGSKITSRYEEKEVSDSYE